MIKSLQGKFDLLYVDGRLTLEDLILLKPLMKEDCIIAFDDYEGIQKGVANHLMISENKLFPYHLIIYPYEEKVLSDLGFTDISSTACLIPFSLIKYTNQ